MKLNIRKISAMGASILLTGMTMGMAAAAAYPAPFIVGGVDKGVAIVYGTGEGVSYLDVVEAGYVQSNLQSKMGSTGGATGSVTGEGKILNSGTKLLYLLDDLAENVPSVTKNDLPTILADGKFVDNDGAGFEYEQTIVVGTSTTNRLSFGDSAGDFDDPAMMLELSTSDATPIYTWTINFNKATNLTSSVSEGEEIEIFGKTYTIATSTDTNTLVLLGGADMTRVEDGEAVPMVVGDVTYQVSLDALSSATATEASVTIDGVTKTFTQGQTKTYIIGDANLEVYVKTVFPKSGNAGGGHIEISLGADKLTFETDSAVKYGSEDKEIEVTKVTVTPTPGGATAEFPGFGNITKLEIAIAAEDSDMDYILEGESFTDPVFGTVKLELNSVHNGPVFEAEQDTGRTSLKLVSSGDRELEVELTDSAGVTKKIPFAYNNIMQGETAKVFHTIEGDNMTDEDYFILNSGDYEHLMQVKSLNFNDITGKVEILDIFSGLTHKFGDDLDYTGDIHTQSGGQNLTLFDQTYTATNTSKGSGTAAGVVITRAGAAASANRAVFPYIELVAGEDFPRVTLINTTNRFNDSTGDLIATAAAGTRSLGKVYDLPTGTVQFGITNGSTADGSTQSNWVEYGTTPSGGSTTTWANISGSNKSGGNHTSITVGEGVYIFGTTTLVGAVAIGAANVTIDNVTLSTWLNATNGAATLPGDGKLLSPAIMFVEDKDKSDSDARNVVVINTTDDATYSEQGGDILFSGTSQSDSETWKETKLKGYLTNYGTYGLRDQTDTNIHIASLTYGTEQMYADVYFAELAATITAGTSGGSGQIGNILVTDGEVSSVKSKNLIVIGGSCINSAAATLVGGAHCSAAFTTATGVGSGQFIIKGYESSALTNSGKIALLVAGYDVQDTVIAATTVRTKAFDTSKEYLGTTATSTISEVTAVAE